MLPRSYPWISCFSVHFSFYVKALKSLLSSFMLLPIWNEHLKSFLNEGNSLRVLSWRRPTPITWEHSTLHSASSQVQFAITNSCSNYLPSPCLHVYNWSCLRLFVSCPLPYGILYTHWETSFLSATSFYFWLIFSNYTLMVIFKDVLFFRLLRLLNSTIFLNKISLRLLGCQ